MKKFIFFIVLAAIIAMVIWRYMPENLRAKTAAFVGTAVRRDRSEIKRFVEDAILPQDQKKRRAVLIEELRTNIEEIKRRNIGSYESEMGIKSQKNIGGKGEEGSETVHNKNLKIADKTPSGFTTKELIIRSENMIQELEGANDDENFLRKEVAVRVLDKILPPKKELENCINVEETK